MIRLGIPLDMGLEPELAGETSIDLLDQINQLLNSESASERGSSEELDSVDQILKENAIPDRYRSVARLLLLASDPTPVFQSLSTQRPDDHAIYRPVARAITEPAIVLFLAFVGLIFLCLFVLPHIESQYEQIWRKPSGVTAALLSVRDLMPWWLITVPVFALIVFLLLRHRLPKLLLNVIPGGRRYVHWLQSAARTNRLAAVISNQHPAANAGSIAHLAGDNEQNEQPIIERVLRESPGSTHVESLQKLSKFYTHLAKTRHRQFFTGIPTFFGILLAGIVVLVYALATFVPWIEMLSVLGERRFEQ